MKGARLSSIFESHGWRELVDKGVILCEPVWIRTQEFAPRDLLGKVETVNAYDDDLGLDRSLRYGDGERNVEWSAPGWKSSSFPKRVVESFSPRQKKCLKNAKIARIVLTALGFF